MESRGFVERKYASSDDPLSWSWYVYTTKSPTEVVAFDVVLCGAIDARLDGSEIDDEMADPGRRT